MSVLNKCLRFSWDVVQNPNHFWGGTSDLQVESLAKSRLFNLTDDYKVPIKPKTPKWYQLAIPLIMMLRNTKHPLIAERNFYWNANPAKLNYYPKDWGEHLTTGDRDAIQKLLQIKPEHRFVLYMTSDPQKEVEFTSRLVMTHAFTTYTIPSVMSLNDLASLIADNSYGVNDNVLEALKSSPLLVLTDIFGECEDLRKAVGNITSILKERMCKGRTTVFVDSVHLFNTEDGATPPEQVSAFNQTKASLAKELRENVSNVTVMRTPLTAFIFGGMTLAMNDQSFVKGKHTTIE